MKTPTIAFIGAGNMATSIVGGLVEAGHPADCIRAADPFPESIERLQQIAPVHVCSDNREAARGADVIILAVKPQVMAEVCRGIAEAVTATAPLVISIAAGITIDSMLTWLGRETAIVRCMPNTPALLGCGASGLFANANTSDQQRAYAEQVLSAVGILDWVPKERDLNAVTALSGSGPAYFFYVMQAINDAALNNGLDAETARLLTLETALGAARLALESAEEPGTLQKRVTSPGGTTEAAINVLESSGVRDAFQNAV
ncbi:MAG: pyrroline-5-carboxylate reductase, partial [Halieaceae bacterium]|nr:pyrroline-5-carboxylate reductase [Halieaceae bacterium]